MGISDQGLGDMLKGLKEQRRTSFGFSTSTGVISLDAALGGKLPSGVIEIYGEASAGKTTLLYEILATAQRSGMPTALCPSEYLDLPYMRRLGVDLNSLVLITGNAGEEAMWGGLEFLRHHRGDACVLAIDSATSFRPRIDDPGKWLGMVSAFCAMALRELPQDSCVLMVNQVRTKRSIEPNRFFVDGKVDSTGKKILESFCTRLELSRGEEHDDHYSLLVNIVANVTFTPSVILDLPVQKGQGIDTVKDLLRYALDHGVVEEHGSWYTFDGQRIGHGVENTVKFLQKEKEVVQRLLDRVMQRA